MKKFIPNKSTDLQYSVKIPEIIDENGFARTEPVDIELSISYLFGIMMKKLLKINEN